jgi:hypothetical protein
MAKPKSSSSGPFAQALLLVLTSPSRLLPVLTSPSRMNLSELVRIELDNFWRFSSRFSGRFPEEALIGSFLPFQGVPLQWAHYHLAAPRLCQRTMAPSAAPRRIRRSSASPLAEASGRLLVLSHSQVWTPPTIPVGRERPFHIVRVAHTAL